MKVVKLGGSLLDDPKALTQCLSTIEKAKEKIVIVPGGGLFADQVRAAQQQWNFNEVVVVIRFFCQTVCMLVWWYFMG